MSRIDDADFTQLPWYVAFLTLEILEAALTPKVT